MVKTFDSRYAMQLILEKATLIKRYKRFLADIVVDDGNVCTSHVANTGAMTNCGTAGDTIWLSRSTNSKRKYPLSWELTETANQQYICVNTHRANQLVEQALLHGDIAPLSQFSNLKREVSYGEERSKIDFLLTGTNHQQIYVEVKSVTLLDDKQGYFPDAITVRGQKHLRELTTLAKQGQRTIILFAVLHTDIQSVMPAAHIDPNYALLAKQAQQAGVEFYAYGLTVQASQQQFNLALNRRLTVSLT